MVIWRHRNPTAKQFSCFSKAHGSLSRIDLAVGNPAMLSSVLDISYKPRCVSDHSYMVINLIVSQQTTLPRAPWKFNAFWLQLFTSHVDIEGNIKKFSSQLGYLSVLTEWETFKTHLKKILSNEVTKIKRHSEALRETLESHANSLKAKYVQDPTDSAREAWQSAQSAYEHLLASSWTKRGFCLKLLFLRRVKRQAVFWLE